MRPLIRLAVGGVPASALRLRGSLDVPIRVAYEDQSLATPERLPELEIYRPKGPVPLRGLASIEPALGQTVITREDLRNTIDVTNNSIFLIEFIQQASSQGMPRAEAMGQAVRLRLRPVLMTTISTFVGVLPMILETAVGLERMSPLAAAAGFGLLVGTVMRLVITPVTYTLLDDAARFTGAKST